MTVIVVLAAAAVIIIINCNFLQQQQQQQQVDKIEFANEIELGKKRERDWIQLCFRFN